MYDFSDQVVIVTGGTGNLVQLQTSQSVLQSSEHGKSTDICISIE